MERKIGEVFEYEGKRLVDKETNIGSCTDCFFKLIGCTPQAKGNTGACSSMTRTDNKSVIFVQVTEGSEKQQAEQPQDEQPQELNLCEILKDCPQSEPFWSPLLGGVKFHDINQKRNFIVISLENGETWDINADGTITFGDVTSPEIMLYPSKEQRDWTKVKYEPKKERFDPKTLKAFDRVLVRSENIFNWNCSLFSNIDDFSSKYPFSCLSMCYRFCIPYNDDTKHLVGTKEEAPEFYRYWED